MEMLTLSRTTTWTADARRAGDANADEAIAVAAREQPEAFITLYDRFARRIGRYALGRVHYPAVAEDVVSVVFTQALTRINTYDPPRGPFAAWLFGIARHAVAAHYRRGAAMADADLLERVEDPGASPEERALRDDERRAVRTAMRRLTEDQQEALALRYLGKLSFAEVGRSLGKSEAAAKMLVKRGLAVLRRYLRAEELR
jgi:RNA polymerase sigma-70 factor (ECF subfamily)